MFGALGLRHRDLLAFPFVAAGRVRPSLDVLSIDCAYLCWQPFVSTSLTVQTLTASTEMIRIDKGWNLPQERPIDKNEIRYHVIVERACFSCMIMVDNLSRV